MTNAGRMRFSARPLAPEQQPESSDAPAGSTMHLVARAVALIGRQQLLRQLEVPASLLDDWLCGRAAMPDSKLFLLAAMLENLADGS